MDEIYRCCLLLQVEPDCTVAQLRARYRILAREWHPDRQQNPRLRELAEARLLELNLAMETLLKAHEITERQTNASLPNTEKTVPHYDRRSWVEGSAAVLSGRSGTTADDIHLRALRLHFAALRLLQEGHQREAVSAFMQSVCLVQNNPEAHSKMGDIYRALNLPAKAAASYRVALRIEPDDDESRYGLARCLLTMGDRIGAASEAEVLQQAGSMRVEDLLLVMG